MLRTRTLFAVALLAPFLGASSRLRPQRWMLRPLVLNVSGRSMPQ
jgi:hypothetical protein